MLGQEHCMLQRPQAKMDLVKDSVWGAPPLLSKWVCVSQFVLAQAVYFLTFLLQGDYLNKALLIQGTK